MGPIKGMTRPLPVAADIVPEAQCFNAKLSAAIHNRFDVEIIDSTTGEVRQRAQAENVICAGFWNQVCKAGGYDPVTQYIQVGTGLGTPAASDTSLFKYAAGYTLSAAKNSNTVVTDNTANSVYSIRRLATISETELVGSKISEVGISTSTSGSLMTHAMLTDANGNAVTINKTATDIINVYSTVFIHYAGLLTTGWTLSSEDYVRKDFFLWVIGVWSFNTTNATPELLYNGSSNVGMSYRMSSANKKGTFTATRMPASDGNISGGIARLRVSFRVGNSIDEFISTSLPASWYAGSNITGEAIGTGNGSTTTFATDFPYATNAVVYVDGVAQSGVTVTSQSTIGNNIIFATAPASGAVITADYHTSVIAKDANHVFDFSLAIQFGEHTA